jgi:hypothetical protein
MLPLLLLLMMMMVMMMILPGPVVMMTFSPLSSIMNDYHI